MVNSKIYSRIGKLLSVIAVMIAVAVPLQVFVFAGFEKYAIPISLGVPFLFIGLGYLLQMVVSRIIGYAPVGYEGEGNIRLDYIDKKAIAFPILVCIAEGVGIYFLIVFLLDKFEVIYDPYNLYLYLIPVFLALFSAAGCVFWFIPYGKILPMEMLPVYFSVFAFTYVFSLFFKISSLFLSICVLIFFPLFMVVNNLQNIEQSIKHAKFRMPENGFRSYNFALTVKYILITLLIIAVTVSAFYAVISNLNFKPSPLEVQGSEWEERDVSSGSSSQSIGDGERVEYDASLKENTGGTTPLQMICYIVVIGAFIAIVGYWLYKKHLLLKFFAVLGILWQSFFEFIAAVFELIGKIGTLEKYEMPFTYVDREEIIDYEDYMAHYSEHHGLEQLSIKEFDSILASKEDPEEEYAYAYSTYCGLVRMGDNGIKRSDTPRVLTQKLKAQRKADLEKATPLYEEIRYRLTKPLKNSGTKEFEELVHLVHSLLRSI